MISGIIENTYVKYSKKYENPPDKHTEKETLMM